MRRSERRPTEIAFDLRDPTTAVHLLRGFLSDALNVAALRLTLADGNAFKDLSGLADQEVLRQLAWQIVRGDTVVVARAEKGRQMGRAVGPAEPGPEPAAEPAQPTPAREKLSWIEIEMVDELGTALVGEKYEIVLPNGSIRLGSLGSLGRVRINEVDPGTCKIRFPDLDAEAWEVSASAR